MDYPPYSLYELLYARYLQPKRTRQLLELCGDLHGKVLLDLCGGGGRASRMALQMGASRAVLVDESADMAARSLEYPDIYTKLLDVESALLPGVLGDAPFDAVLCQQAVNYWFKPELAPALHRATKTGAKLVFNTFWEAPPTMPAPKSYEYEGLAYLELSWRSAPAFIEHVQVCKGLAPHTTRFQWIEPETFHRSLSPWFDVQELREGKTSVYCCTALDVPRHAL